MLAFSKILDLLRSRLSPNSQRASSFHSIRSHKRSAFHSFSSSRSSPAPPPLASYSSPLPGRPLDVVIHNLHADAWGTARAARPIPVETLLAHILAVIARRHIRLHSVAATAFSITLVIDDSLHMIAHKEYEYDCNVSPPSSHARSRPDDNDDDDDVVHHTFRSLVAELVNAVDGVDLRDTSFICDENRRNRILGQRRTHEW